MPLENALERGASDPANPYCGPCTDTDGSLKARDIVRDQMIKYWLRNQPVTREEAEQATDGYMAKMPAWQAD